MASKLGKIAIIGSSLGLAIVTTPLELSVLPSELHLIYLAFKAWMFGAVPVFFFLLERQGNK